MEVFEHETEAPFELRLAFIPLLAAPRLGRFGPAFGLSRGRICLMESRIETLKAEAEPRHRPAPPGGVRPSHGQGHGQCSPRRGRASQPAYSSRLTTYVYA